jgi:hypothetical protein
MLPASIQAIERAPLDIVERYRRLRAEAARLGIRLLFDTQLTSRTYGRLLGVWAE